MRRLIQYVLGLLTDVTSQQIKARYVSEVTQWGTFFSIYMNITVIRLIYSVISPLILVLNVLIYTLFLIV